MSAVSWLASLQARAHVEVVCLRVCVCVSVHGVCVLTLLSKVSPQENLETTWLPTMAHTGYTP